MELESDRVSPTLTSRYMSTYITNAPDVYHQNYHTSRQPIPSFYPIAENDRNCLKRHYFIKDEADSDERERKYEKLEHSGFPLSYHSQELYDTYNNNNSSSNPSYLEAQTQERNETDSIGITNTNSVENYPLNGSPASSTSDKLIESPKSVTSGKKTKGRVKIKMEYIENKLRRYTTFSKRKTGIMKKAYELSTLTGTQVMLLVASETGHVYTFATRKLQPMITSDAGKQLIQTCLNSPENGENPNNNSAVINEQRMSATGFEETELTFDIQELSDPPEKQKVRQLLPYNSPSSLSHHQSAMSQTLPTTHTHLYTLPPPTQHYSSSPQSNHLYGSPHYSPPSPSITSQHFQPPTPSQYPSYYENNGNSSSLNSYQSIRTPSVPITPPMNSSSGEATR